MQMTQETWVQSLDWEDPLEKDMATISLQPIAPVFLAGKFHGQSCLVGYSSQGHRVRQDRVRVHTHTVTEVARPHCGGWEMRLQPSF